MCRQHTTLSYASFECEDILYPFFHPYAAARALVGRHSIDRLHIGHLWTGGNLLLANLADDIIVFGPTQVAKQDLLSMALEN